MSEKETNSLYLQAWKKKVQEESAVYDVFGYYPVYPRVKTIWGKIVWWFVWKIHSGQMRRAEKEWYSQTLTISNDREEIPEILFLKNESIPS